MKPDARNCPETTELVAFSRGALDAARTRVVEEHVASCADCRASTQDEQDSGTFGRMLRDWRSRMTPEERRQSIDSAARSIEAARRDGRTPP